MKVFARPTDNIWATDLAEMRSFSSFNSTHDDCQPIVAERFVKPLKGKIYKK